MKHTRIFDNEATLNAFLETEPECGVICLDKSTGKIVSIPTIVRPDNEIWYTSTDGNIVVPKEAFGGVNIVSNTYADGKGVIKFDISEKSLIFVDANAFKGCNTLKSIKIPNTVTLINQYAFDNCSSLVRIKLSNKLTTIEKYAFNYCTALTSIVIPTSVSTIKVLAFVDCTNLVDINYNGTKKQWNSISKGSAWNLRVPATAVHCTDGDVAIEYIG